MRKTILKLLGFDEIVVGPQHRAIVMIDGKFAEILEPGRHYLRRSLRDLRIHRSDVEMVRYDGDHEQTLVRDNPQLLDSYFAVADVADNQIAIVTADGKVHDTLAPGLYRLYWNVLKRIEVELVDVEANFEVSDTHARKMAHLFKHNTLLSYNLVPDGHVGLLYVDGKFDRILPPGAHAFWRGQRKIEMSLIDGRLREKEIVGQEVLTKDKVGIRVNLTCHYRIDDPVKVAGALASLDDYMHKSIQFALREAVGRNTLDDILDGKDRLDAAVREDAAAKFEAYGVSLHDIGVKDVVLPGDMRAIMNQVVQAEKAAQASLIQRREETAATRSLLNTAKLMDDNPTLMRLKELESLERIVDKVETLNVVGGLDGVLNELGKLKTG